MNIAHVIKWRASRDRQKTAFVWGDRHLTFGEADSRSNRLANGLSRLGIGRGDRVGVAIGNRLEYAEADFAIAKLGAVRVPVMVNSSARELAWWFGTAEVAAIIMSSEAAEQVRAALPELNRSPILVCIDDAVGNEVSYEKLVEASPDIRPDVDLTGDDIYAIRFTGGTTGVPKGVVMTHRNWMNLTTNMLLNWPIDGTDVGLHVHPMSHMAGMMMHCYWAAGAKQVINPAFRLDADELLRTIERHRVTSLFIVPTVLTLMLESNEIDRADTSSLRSIVYGGSPTSATRLRQALDRFGPIFLHAYGCSEAPPVLTTLHREEHQFDGDEPPNRLRSVGREILNVEVRIVDESGQLAPTGTVGEIVARGDNTMLGYWKNEELTAKRLRNGWVHTGDMGYFDEDGYLYLVDRKEDMIRTGGLSVWPSDIEDVIYTHPSVSEAAVFGVDDPRWGEAVFAAVVPKKGHQITEGEIIEYLETQLTKYKIPKRVFVRSEPIPKSPAGKPLRRLVRAEHQKLT